METVFSQAGGLFYFFIRKEIAILLKKIITYTDYNGVERTEPFYFNLSKAELMEMELGVTGGMTEMLDKIIDAKDAPSLMKTFKEMIMKAYGVKSDDGKRLIKSEELSIAFTQTEAYSVLFMELITDDKAAADFVNGIIPNEIQAEVATQTANNT